MTKIKGTAKIKIYDPNIPGSEKYIELENYVTERGYRDIYHWTANHMELNNINRNHRNIFIANRPGYVINKTGINLRFTYDSNVSINNPSGGLLDYGTKPVSQISPIAYNTSDINVPFVQFYNRINPPTVTRSFNIIGLCTEGPGITTLYPLTILMVEPVCTQSNTEFIDVVYNLEIVKGSSYFFGNQFQKDWVNGYVVSGDRFNMSNTRCSYCALPANTTQNNGYEFLNVKQLSLLQKFNTTLGLQSNHPPLKHGKYIDLNPGDLSSISTNALGFVINTLFIGEGNRNTEELYPYYWETNSFVGTSPFQSKFNKKTDAIYPFWEPTDTPNASGDILFSGTWLPSTRFPEILKVIIVEGGPIGTATYRLQIKKFVRLCGQNENNSISTNSGHSWNMNRGDVVPFLNPVLQHPRHHGISLTSPKALWKDERVVMYDMTGITIINLYDGSFQTWDADSTPALNVTAICQCEPLPSDNLIYVACRNTGLYIINTVSNTVVRLNPDPCYGVCKGGSGKVYAIFEGRISSSDSWTTPLTLVSAGITTGNTPDAMTPSWSRVRYIKANPWDTTDKLAIVITRNSGTIEVFGNGNRLTGYVVWWSPTLGSTPCIIFNNGSGINVTTNPNAIACHPSIDSWIIPHGCLAQWGSNGTTNLIANNLNITKSIYWSDAWHRAAYNSITAPVEIKNKLGWDKWFGVDISTNTFNCSIYYAIFYNGYVISDNNLINANNGTIYMTLNNVPINAGQFENGGSMLIIKGDLSLQWGYNVPGNYQLINIFRTHEINGALTQGWIDYGWNGNSWVEGSTTSRITHGTGSPGPNGVNITFVDGATQIVPSFIPGQYMLQYLCHGLLIDNTISWYYEVNRYFTDYVTQSFPVGFTVPTISPYEVTLPKYKKIPQNNTHGWVDDGTTDGINSDPDFYSADMQSKRSFNIALGGVTVPYTSIFYWNEKATPGPMEVSIEYTNQRTDRRLRFNVADAGKAITGTYVYMKCPT